MVSLAQVEGNQEYKLAMEAAINGDGILPSYEEALAKSIDTLTNFSEARLGAPIRDFQLAAPWLEMYRYPTEGEDVFTRALQLTRVAGNRPPGLLHVDEAAAVNVANGRQHCPESYCVNAGHFGPLRRLCYLSLTNDALYSSTQSDSCLHLSWGAKAQIDPDVGLDKLTEANADTYWTHLHQRLSASVLDCVRGCLPTTILASGEAMRKAEARSILEAVTHCAQLHCDEHPREPYMNGRGELEPNPTVELVISDDAVFAAAKEAAFSMSRYYWGYCKGVNKTLANHMYWSDDYDDDGYWIPVKTIGPRTG